MNLFSSKKKTMVIEITIQNQNNDFLSDNEQSADSDSDNETEEGEIPNDGEDIPDDKEPVNVVEGRVIKKAKRHSVEQKIDDLISSLKIMQDMMTKRG